MNLTAQSAVKRKRDVGLDVFKGILVLAMVVVHGLKFFKTVAPVGSFALEFEKLCDLICFSGFIFAYGYSNSVAYFNKEKAQVTGKYLKNFFRLLCTFYISGIAYRIICEGRGLDCIPEILLLSDIPPYSEFIACYAVLTLGVYIFFNPIKWILQRPWAVLITVMVSLLFCAFPYELVKYNQLGLLVGSARFASFPVMQYFCLFILGAYAQRVKLDWSFKVLLGCMGASAPYYIKTILLSESADRLRFPAPTVAWIAGGSLVLYVIFVISRRFLVGRRWVTRALSLFGSDISAALLISNIGLFAFTYIVLTKTPLRQLSRFIPLWVLFMAVLLAAIYGWIFVKPKLKSVYKSSNRQ